MMKNLPSHGNFRQVIIFIMIAAIPFMLMAEGTTPATGIDEIKQLRKIQNQQTMLKNLQLDNTRLQATPEQERMLRLSSSLSKAKQQKLPDLNSSARVDLRPIGHALPQPTQYDLRDVMMGSGRMSSHPDSLYFNFLTGMNSGDSTNMDVRITGNEMLNFGNEYANYSDPSLLYWYAELGMLEEVAMVDDIDDPMREWATISWEWVGGNGGLPLSVGNLWVVYARTSDMYVVLEVTEAFPDWTNPSFSFDYMIQTDGSNLFGGAMSNIDITVNGAEGDTLLIGSNPYVEIALDDNLYGEFAVIWDGNHNGVIDDGDLGIELYPFTDNDMHDEDPTDGIFGFTYNDDMADGLNYFTEDLLFAAYVGTGMDVAPVQFYTMPSPLSISGSIYETNGGGPPLQDIVVWAMYEGDDEQPAVIVTTDPAGQYHLDLPEPGNVMIGTEDHFGVTDGFLPDPAHHFVNVQGEETGFNFYYVAPTSGIEGWVTDELGNPIANVEVKADPDEGGGSVYTYTDDTGYYYLGVMVGGYEVDVDIESLSDPYVIPFSEYVFVGDFAVAHLDIVLHSANNFINGVVTLDGNYFEGATVVAMTEFGFSYAMSTTNGNFDIPVHGGPETFYNLMVWIPDDAPLVQTSMNFDIPAGSEGQLITLETITGGLFGFFMNIETMSPIIDGHEIGMMMRHLDTGMEYHRGPEDDGSYVIHVPPGLYEVMAGGMEWVGPDPDTILVEDVLMNYDLYFAPLSFDAYLEGYVYDMGGMPLPYAQVQIGNDVWGNWMVTDEYGYYSFDLPVGYYYISAAAEGHHQHYGDISVVPGYNSYNFFLEPMQIDGAIHGLVYDEGTGNPIEGADVYAYNWDNDEGYWTYTDPSGGFWFDLPNGMYDVVVETWEYPPSWVEGIHVNDDTTYIEIPLVMPNGGVEGWVYDQDGYPIMNAEVIIISMADSMGYWGYTDDSGHFAIPAPNGDYQVFAWAEGFEEGHFGNVSVMDNWVQIDIYLNYYQFAVAPEINFIVDQPNDQGRWVRMQFWPGGTDWGPFHGYSIWRLTNTPMGPIMDFVEYLPYHDFDMYDVVLPTLVDSSAHVPDPLDYMSMFMVTGHYDMYGFIDGDPGMGYSIDNIHPGVPSPLAIIGVDESYVELIWEPSMDADFQYFEVHRATNPDFTDASVGMTPHHGHTDETVEIGVTYYYRVHAVDANGNMSDGSNVVSTSIVSVDEAEMIPTAFGLSQNYPNPFNPTTSIEFALPEAANVSLEIYNLLGQKVRTLVNGYVSAGYVTTRWDGLDQHGQEVGSGTYIYRLKTSEQSFSKKLVLMK